jgi:ABC-type Mn2+/Zn2+ transport system ATPase subunit
MSVTAVEIQNLVVEVDGYPVINNLTLTVEEGKRVGIMGDYSDAVAVLDVFSGLTLPASGEIWVYNMPPRQALQRGLIHYAPNTQHPEPSLVLVTNLLPSQSQAEPAVAIHPFIEFFNELIEKFYISVELTSIRRNVKL